MTLDYRMGSESVKRRVVIQLPGDRKRLGGKGAKRRPTKAKSLPLQVDPPVNIWVRVQSDASPAILPLYPVRAADM